MRKKIACILLLLTFLSTNSAFAQSITIGTQPFTSNVFGPIASSTLADTTYSRHAYIYPSSSLNGLQHGDTIRALSFFKTTFGRYSAGSNCVIYIANTTAPAYPNGRLHWENDTLTVSAKRVFEGNLNFITDGPGFQRFDFNVEDYYVFDTTFGDHLKILVGFNQVNRQTANQNWAYENTISVPAFVSNNETKYQSGTGTPPDSLNGTNVRKPTLRIHIPTEKNLEIQRVYALGQMPILMDKPDTIHLLVANSGRSDVSQVNVEIKVSGANTYSDTVQFDSIPARGSAFFAYGKYLPKNQGSETITARIIGDSFRNDDTASIRRRVNYNVYGHADPFVGNAPGGIGFNGNVSGDFVAKFYCKDTLYMNQVKVDFGFAGAQYFLGLWAADSAGQPGTNLFTSDTLTATTGTNIIPVLPRVKIDTAFFVGIRQINQFVGFAYQLERPIRPNAFYFTSPSGNATWTPFHPGFDFNVNIQPRIQVANDVGIVSVDFPAENDTIDFDRNGSIQPKATVINYGFRDQNIPFDVVCEITDNFGQQLYRDVKLATVKSNDTVQLTFKDFSLANLGRLNVRVYTILNTDNVLDNDTISHNFDIVIRHDVSVERFFEPVNGASIGMNRDTIAPVLRVVNSGITDKRVVNFTLNVIKDGIVYHTQTKQIDIDARGSLITSFDSFVVPIDGEVTLEAYLWGVVDSFPNNDTLRITLKVQRTHDIAVRRILDPVDSSLQLRLDRLFPTLDVRNQGIEDLDSIRFTLAISEESGRVIYADTVVRDVDKLSTAQAVFRRITLPDTNARYFILATAFDDEDQDPLNDTLRSTFTTTLQRDLQLLQQLEPEKDTLLLSGQSIRPEIVSRNNGILAMTQRVSYYWQVQVPNGTFYTDSIERDYTTETLVPGELDTLLFKNYTPTVLGDYLYTFWVSPGDGEPLNDRLNGMFTVSVSKSVTLIDVEVPDDKRYQAYLDTIRPSVVLDNTGLEDLLQGGTVRVDIDRTGQNVYTSTWSFLALEKGETITSEDVGTFVPTERGEYRAILQVNQSEDMVLTDNRDTVLFTVGKDRDIIARSITNPAFNAELNFSDVYAPRASFENDGEAAVTDSVEVVFEVWKDGSRRYQDARKIWLDSAETAEVTFDSSFVPNGLREFTALAYVQPGTDEIFINDSISHIFTVDYGLNASVKTMNGIQIYPNPGELVLYIDSEVAVAVTLLDALGREMARYPESASHELDTRNLAPGGYVIILESKDGIRTMKWLKM
jgi:hypothetical protein